MLLCVESKVVSRSDEAHDVNLSAAARPEIAFKEGSLTWMLFHKSGNSDIALLTGSRLSCCFNDILNSNSSPADGQVPREPKTTKDGNSDMRRVCIQIPWVLRVILSQHLVLKTSEYVAQ